MIYTITFNPALDISGSVEQLVADEKNYVSNELHTPGGNGINAAIIAHRLGADVLALGFLGGTTGREIKDLLDKEKLKQLFVTISGNTRMNLTVSNAQTHRQTRLSFLGPNIKNSEFKKLKFLLKKTKEGDLVLFGGSLPQGISPVSFNRLIRSQNKKGALCMVDVPGNMLAEIISAKPYFIKPNLAEFQQLIGKNVKSIKAILPLARQITDEVPLVCVSSVEGGAILVSKVEAWYGKIPRVKIQSTVGAGDSMVGAMAHLLSVNPEVTLDELLRAGLAASCATLTEQGMVLGSRKSIHRFRNLIQIRRI
jgi:1-phosphofructokinase family hexose kinase